MPIEQDSDQVQRLFGIDDEVGTPEGPGTIMDILFNVADYDGDVQLEPPSIQVALEDGTLIHTCMCELDLGDEDANELVRAEFDRLWPAMTDGVPDDAESTIPEGEEDQMQRQGQQRRSADFSADLYNYLEDEFIYPSELLQYPEAKKAIYSHFADEARRHGADFEDAFLDVEFDPVALLDTVPGLAEILEREIGADVRVFVQGDRPDIDHIIDETLRTALQEFFAANEDIDSSYDVTEGYWGHNGFNVAVVESPGHGEDYGVAAEFDDAEELAVAVQMDSFEADPEAYSSFLQQYIDEARLRDMLQSDVLNMVYEDMEYEIGQDPDRAADEMGVDPDEFDNADGDRDEEALEARLREGLDDYAESEANRRLEDPIAYMQEMFGDDEGTAQAMKIAGADLERAARDVIRYDGIGFVLNSWDSSHEDLNSGGAYWRI